MRRPTERNAADKAISADAVDGRREMQASGLREKTKRRTRKATPKPEPRRVWREPTKG